MKPVTIDAICLHSRDGKTAPLRIRVVDEDGLYQAYTIKECRDVSHQGARIMPDGVYVCDNTLIFECTINVFGRDKQVRLYNEPPSQEWRMTH